MFLKTKKYRHLILNQKRHFKKIKKFCFGFTPTATKDLHMVCVNITVIDESNKVRIWTPNWIVYMKTNHCNNKIPLTKNNNKMI